MQVKACKGSGGAYVAFGRRVICLTSATKATRLIMWCMAACLNSILFLPIAVSSYGTAVYFLRMFRGRDGLYVIKIQPQASLSFRQETSAKILRSGARSVERKCG